MALLIVFELCFSPIRVTLYKAETSRKQFHRLGTKIPSSGKLAFDEKGQRLNNLMDVSS